ncbi:hypothetical protein J4E91_009923 [Alternaria rosae]|nr:hypothetical protein J4E91_009923 [Alternaria rosae]
MSSSSGYQAMPGWYWPDDAPKTEPAHATSSSTGSTSQPPPSATSNTSDNSSSQSRSSTRTHWPPRQCRICLETVQPTFNVPSQSLPGFLQSSNVVYEDESGRLIRPSAQVGLTAIILISIVFVLGFVADPIINLYLDPWSFLSPFSASEPDYAYYYEDESSTWYEHFAKGFASMGVLGFLKVLIASPLSYFRIGGGRGRTTGRDRYEQVSWIIILIGVGTFLAAVYKGVRVWSRRTLERAGERVMDVQGDNDDDDE